MPAREVPVAYACDVCVIGGSTTGLFAALAAARLGASVAIVESLGYFGGTATASLVNVFHSFLDTAFEKRIIAGMTSELIDRLLAREAVTVQPRSLSIGYTFSPAEMILELDAMLREQGTRIRPFLHARFVAAA